MRMRVQSGRKQTKRMRVANVKSDGKHSLCYTLQFSRSKYGVEEEGAQLPLYLCIRGGGRTEQNETNSEPNGNGNASYPRSTYSFFSLIYENNS